MATLALLLVMQAVSSPQAFGDNRPAGPESGAADYRLEGPPPADHDLPSAVYGGLRWSIVETRVEGTGELLGQARIEVDVLVDNTLAETELRFSERMVGLMTRDGTDLGPVRFVDEPSRLAVAPGERLALTVSARTGHDPDPAPASLVLRLAEQGRRATILPLTGGPTGVATPVFAAVDTADLVLPDPDDAERRVLVTPTAAVFTTEAGPYRAALGERLLLVEVAVERAAVTEPSAVHEPGYWALNVDGATVPALIVARAAEPAEGNTEGLTLLFAFGEDADRFELVVGADTPDAATSAVVEPSN